MIGLKMMGLVCGQVVDAAFSRYSGCGRGQGSFLSFSCKKAIHFTPILGLLASPTIPRLKREDIKCIVYDSSFSQWKILIGASDWKEHAAGKEGAERYRTQNLPNCTSPGDYELGVATSACGSGPRKIDLGSVVPVYLGQADNVRARLQSYGRDGSNLDRASASGLLFSDIFSGGFPIVYRWAPMKSKEEAERREEELLGMYDYAWNKRNNGNRRPHDVQTRLAHKTSMLSILRHLALRCFNLGGKIDHPEFWR